MGEVTVRVVGQRATKKIKVASGMRITGLLEQLGQNRETVVVRLNGKIVAEDERLRSGDSVEILPVVTGG